ncbi:MAG TPA: hypothetical protein VD907_05615 [Verrucomicrobiae bacterium]|nr:hypothetical protein [Verrucomicrobiae bacterium]
MGKSKRGNNPVNPQAEKVEDGTAVVLNKLKEFICAKLTDNSDCSRATEWLKQMLKSGSRTLPVDVNAKAATVIRELPEQFVRLAVEHGLPKTSFPVMRHSWFNRIAKGLAKKTSQPTPAPVAQAVTVPQDNQSGTSPDMELTRKKFHGAITGMKQEQGWSAETLSQVRAVADAMLASGDTYPQGNLTAQAREVINDLPSLLAQIAKREATTHLFEHYPWFVAALNAQPVRRKSNRKRVASTQEKVHAFV